jgi:AcrR family transcriptional regulator
VSEPRFKRRKEDRPAEITEAAMTAFAENGYSSTSVEEVARRAGVSKGLLYLYFKTKEDLFKAVIRSFVSPRLDTLIRNIEDSELSSEAFLRGPFSEFAKFVPRSPARILVRLIIAEGPNHPDLLAWYWEHVVSRGIAALKMLLRRGIDAGEFRASALEEFPQLLVSPILFAVVWKRLFAVHAELDIDRFVDAHIDTVLRALKVESS